MSGARFPPKRILVPYDGTEAAAAVALEARGLADRFGAELQALHVAPRREDAFEEELAARCRSAFGAGVVLGRADGEPPLVISERARDFDLVVMGTHGRTGLGRAIVGSTTEETLVRSPAPVLAVREKPFVFDHILAPVNFASYAEIGFLYAAAAAEAFGLPLRVLYVQSNGVGDAEARQAFERLVERLPAHTRDAVRAEFTSVRGRPMQGILEAAARGGLPVVTVHPKPLFEELTLGTTAERVIRHHAGPVFAVPGGLAASRD